MIEHGKLGRVRLRMFAMVFTLAFLVTACAGGNGVDDSARDAAGTDEDEGGSVAEETQDSDEAEAVEFPTGPVTLVVFSSPGSGLDIGMRTLAEILAEETGVPWTVENRDGGGGVEAGSYLQSQEPDGHTLGAWTGTLVAKVASGEFPFEVDDFLAIARLETQPFFWFVRESSEFMTMEQLSAALSDGSESVTVGGPGTGSALHLGALKFAEAAGIEFTWVPFPGSAEVTTAVLGGHVDVGYGAAREEGLRVLAATSVRPAPLHPDAPTLVDLGYEVEDLGWRGIFGPQGMEPSLQEAVARRIQSAAQDSRYQSLVDDRGEDYDPMALTEFDEWYRELYRDTVEMRAQLGLD